ncbi:hypothetical protein BH23VER1_BH23VER1_27330 [soil metagenome]
MRRRHHRPWAGGDDGRAAPVLIVLGALALSVAAFILFTLPRTAPQEAKPSTIAEAEPGGDEPALPPDLGDETDDEVAVAEPDPTVGVAPATRPEPLADPTDFIAQLIRSAAEGDAAPGEPAAALRLLFRESGFELAGEDAIVELGKIGDIRRFAVEILAGGSPPVRSRITIDLKAVPGGGWAPVQSRIPEALESYLADIPAPPPPPGAPPARRPDAGDSDTETKVLVDVIPPADADALEVASAFLEAVLARDFPRARRLAEPARLSDEKLAALFIVLEDGEFRLATDRAPLLATAARPDAAWVIARLASAADAPDTEFGIELESGSADDPTETPWRVVGLNFSQVIAEVAESLGAGAVAYAPIITNPGGGESLVLYFPFNEAEIYPRAGRQLAIVAEILRADPAKSITIDGHADGVGSAGYNDALSDRRARNVRDALADLGVPASQVVTRAFGKQKPIEPNFYPDGTDNPAGRTRNRRTEVYLDF